MATTSSSPSNSSGQLNGLQSPLSESNARLLFLGHIREIRAEAQNLQRYALDLKGKLTDQHLSIVEVAKTWQTIQIPVYQSNDAHVKDLFTIIKKLMEDHPLLLERDGDAITTMENIWERIDPQWPRFPENQVPDENTVLAQIAAVDATLCEVIRAAEILTLPERVNERLKELHVGQTINFHAEFSDELPELPARISALKYMHDHPLIILGVVDVDNGLIYRASSNPWQQRLSPVYVALPAVLGGCLVYLAYTFMPLLKGNVPHNFYDVLPYIVAYIAVIAGGFAHTAVDTVKQYRASNDQSFTALGDLLMWIHVKQAPLFAGILLLWIGFIGLVLLQGPDWQAGFFIGYSIDSFIDIFLQRFTSVASVRTDALKAQFTPATR